MVSDVSPRDMLLVLGDFNARVGSDFQSWRSVIGPHGMGDCNDNGERLLDFCSNNQLLVTNTWFKHKSIHKTTWFQNGNRSRPGHIIDYILVNRRFRSSILDTRVYRSVLHESDHELVVSTLRFKIKTKCHQSTVPHRQTTNLHADIKSDFRTHLSDAFSHIPNDASIESCWNAFKSAINSACTVLPEDLSSHDPDWVTDELRNLSQKKSNTWLSYRDAAKRGYEVKSHREEYKHFCKLTKEAAEKARNAWWTARAVEAERRAWVAEQLGHGGSFIKELRLLRNRFTKPSSSTLTALDGSPLTNDTAKLARWTEHFSSIVNCGVEVSEASLENLPVISPSVHHAEPPDLDDLCAPLSEEEICTAISQLKNSRAPGMDGITAEMIKLGGAESVRWFKSLFDAIWHEEEVPEDWKSQLLIPLHKKGSRTICDNYRGIALLSTPSKVFTKAILNRVKPRTELLLRESQCGFRSGRGCADHLFSVRTLMEKAREFHRPLYICFIDLRKAYDSINREALWSILQSSYHLPAKLISIIRAVHDGSRAAVRAYGRVSESFDVTCGVRQGCVLAPTLFNLYFDAVVHMSLDSHQVQNKCVGVAYLHNAKLVGNRRKLQLETLVTDLEYADDMALLADSWNDLEAMLTTLSIHCSAFGLSISCSKTKTMAVLPASHCAPPVPIRLFPNHPPHTALWHRMCCVVADAYPSVAKLHYALFAYNPGYLCLGYEA